MVPRTATKMTQGLPGKYVVSNINMMKNTKKGTNAFMFNSGACSKLSLTFSMND